MNLPQVSAYLEREEIPALEAQPSSLAWWASKPIDLTRWMLRSELQRSAYGAQKRDRRGNRGHAWRSRPVLYRGVQYESIVAAAKAHGTPTNTVRSRLEALGALPKRGK